jgi:peroxiredoxin
MRWLRNILKGRTGGRFMAALAAGTKAPDFTLKAPDGKRFSLSEELGRRAVLLAFFKVSCPVCQYALPYLERLHKAYREKGYRLAGVSQDNAQETAAFNKEFGVTFPVLLDDTRTYPVSNAYGLTNVPTVFWIAPDGEIEVSSVGWLKADFEDINRRMAEADKISVTPLFNPGEDVPDFRAG